MGFLANIFKSKELRYLEGFVLELKQDKTLLQEEIKQLKEDIAVLRQENIKLNNKLNININNNNNVNNNKNIKLTKLETKIYNSYMKHNPKTMTDLSKLTGVKESSLRVYCSKLNKKVQTPISFR